MAYLQRAFGIGVLLGRRLQHLPVNLRQGGLLCRSCQTLWQSTRARGYASNPRKGIRTAKYL